LILEKRSYHLVSLGCAKNTVDSESMAALLHREGYAASQDPEQAQVLIVNTCGFIGPAKDESLSVLRTLSDGKKQGQVLIAAGCLTQRYGSEIIEQVPGIDGLLGTRRWMDIVKVVQNTAREPVYHLPEVAVVGSDEKGVLRAAIQGASAYLKIADGCRRPCAFCAIPLIKGTAVSRPMETLLVEVEKLQDAGVREINLIAQDTTDYGHDLGIKNGLAKLLDQMVGRLDRLDWIRLLYAYPGYVTDKLIDVMAKHEQILPYLDIPLQHAHPDTLKRMRRPANMEWVNRTIDKLRGILPELALRTTFIVGYPGETEAEFDTLLKFVEQVRFDRVGAFTFSFEPGTSSEPLGDPVPHDLKEERRDRLMLLQQQISLEKNQSLMGSVLDVLIEGNGDGISMGRTYRDAPEIDGMVIVEGEIPVGELVPVRITGAMAYDVSGVPVQFEDLIRL
jgi:ribosomal protein S12 methylthiotransferase